MLMIKAGQEYDKNGQDIFFKKLLMKSLVPLAIATSCPSTFGVKAQYIRVRDIRMTKSTNSFFKKGPRISPIDKTIITEIVTIVPADMEK